MATHEDGTGIGAATIGLPGDDTLRVGETLEHVEYGPITATRILAEEFGRTAFFAVETSPGDLAVSLTGRQLRDGWGEEIARDPFELAEGGPTDGE